MYHIFGKCVESYTLVKLYGAKDLRLFIGFQVEQLYQVFSDVFRFIDFV